MCGEGGGGGGGGEDSLGLTAKWEKNNSEMI